MSNHSTADTQCPCRLHKEASGTLRCGQLCGGNCKLLTSLADRSYLYDTEDENKEELAPGLRVAIPFTYLPYVFDTIHPVTRMFLLSGYDRLVAFGKGEFWDKLEQVYQDAERCYGCNSAVVTPTELEVGYETFQHFQRTMESEPVGFVDGRCCFRKFIFDEGFMPGPFSGLERYTRNGRFVTQEEIEWLRERARCIDSPLVGPFGYQHCPIRLVDIFQEQVKLGRYGRITYSIAMAEKDASSSAQ